MSELLPGYRIVRGSDLQRDGMFLELIDESTGDEVAEVFYSDVTHKMTISVFQRELPLEVIEVFTERAKHDLPPSPLHMTVAEAKRLIHDPELTHDKGKRWAAATFMELCERDQSITFDDMLRCLDYGGTIASMGARCLYVRSEWERYLREHRSYKSS